MDVGNYKQCTKCRGLGTYSPLGFMQVTCDKCNGKKYSNIELKDTYIPEATPQAVLKAKRIDKRSKIYREMKAKAERLHASTENKAFIQPVTNNIIGVS